MRCHKFLALLAAAALPATASARPNRAIVPTWAAPRQIEVGPTPLYFTYKDGISGGASHDAESDRRFQEWRKQRAKNGWFCDRVVHLTDGLASVTFTGLPTGPSQFDIRCTGNCQGLKYAIAAGAFQYIYHSGFRADFVTVSSPSPTNFMLKTNLGFAFFLDDPGTTETTIVRVNPAPVLPAGTEVTLIHWRAGLMSSFGGHDCSG